MDCQTAPYLNHAEVWIISQVNQYRAEAGAHPVTPSAELLCAARLQAAQTILSGEQSHILFGTSPQDRASACGYTEKVQENVIAWAKTVMDADKGLEASSVHAFIRRRPEQKEVGVSIAYDFIRAEAAYKGGAHFPLALVEVYGHKRTNKLAGVVYFDSNNNSSFDISEGIGGIILKSKTDCAITAPGGNFELEYEEGMGIGLLEYYIKADSNWLEFRINQCNNDESELCKLHKIEVNVNHENAIDNSILIDSFDGNGPRR